MRLDELMVDRDRWRTHLTILAGGDLEEVPGSECKRQDRKPVRHPRIPASVNLPASPESDAGGNDHQYASERIHLALPDCGPRFILANGTWIRSRRRAGARGNAFTSFSRAGRRMENARPSTSERLCASSRFDLP